MNYYRYNLSLLLFSAIRRTILWLGFDKYTHVCYWIVKHLASQKADGLISLIDIAIMCINDTVNIAIIKSERKFDHDVGIEREREKEGHTNSYITNQSQNKTI